MELVDNLAGGPLAGSTVRLFASAALDLGGGFIDLCDRHGKETAMPDKIFVVIGGSAVPFGLSFWAFTDRTGVGILFFLGALAVAAIVSYLS